MRRTRRESEKDEERESEKNEGESARERVQESRKVVRHEHSIFYSYKFIVQIVLNLLL